MKMKLKESLTRRRSQHVSHFYQFFLIPLHLLFIGCAPLIYKVHSLAKCCDFGLKTLYSFSTSLYIWTMMIRNSRSGHTKHSEVLGLH